MLGEGSSTAASGALELVTFLADDNLAGGALGHLISPAAAMGVLVESESGRTLIPIGLAINTFPEDAAVLNIWEGSVEIGTVPGGDGGLQLKPVSALYKVQLCALL
jgi:hypothetical protein